MFPNAVTAKDFNVGELVRYFDSQFVGVVIAIHAGIDKVDVEFPQGIYRHDPEDLMKFRYDYWMLPTQFRGLAPDSVMKYDLPQQVPDYLDKQDPKTARIEKIVNKVSQLAKSEDKQTETNYANYYIMGMGDSIEDSLGSKEATLSVWKKPNGEKIVILSSKKGKTFYYFSPVPWNPNLAKNIYLHIFDDKAKQQFQKTFKVTEEQWLNLKPLEQWEDMVYMNDTLIFKGFGNNTAKSIEELLHNVLGI